MNSLENSFYTAAQMARLLKGNRKIGFRYELLNKNDKPIGKVTASGYIDFNSAADIKRVASLQIKEAKDIDFLTDRIKPYMLIYTKKGTVEYPLGVFMMDSPNRLSEGTGITRSVECYDKTIILRDDKLTARTLFAKGTLYTAAIDTMIASAGITYYRVEPSEKQLRQDLEFEPGTSKLQVINTLAAAINYNDVYVDSSGCVIVKAYTNPEARTVEFVYATDKNSVVLPRAEETQDLFNIPNKIVRWLETPELECIVAMAENTDPTNKLSIVNRGRTIVDAESVSDIADRATLEAYVARLAAEAKIYQTVTISTALMPHHEFLDCLYIVNDKLGVSGKYIEQSWNMELTVGGAMRHVCKRTVSG